MRIATWIRDKDERFFAETFAFAKEVHLENARKSEVDVLQADALLLSGGEDIGSEYLAQPVADPALIHDPDARRDAWEFSAVKEGFARRIPILAICRGHQVLNVALGGTLHLDITGHAFYQRAGEDVHQLRYAPGVPEWLIYPKVNSTHHQSIDRLAPGLEVLAWCESDNTIEVVRHVEHPFCLGVQYHPERSPAFAPLFREFVRAAGSPPPIPH